MEWIDRLIHSQLTHIPFDAMDCWGKGETPSLAIDDLFDKIIVRHRGGYCFELNSLFCTFLRALGYETYIVVVHLLHGFTPPPAHCAVVCIIDSEKYFCDVGYGGPQRPNSNFQMKLNVNLRMEDGNVWISDRVFNLSTSSERIEREIRDVDDLRELLERYFGIPGTESPLREFD